MFTKDLRFTKTYGPVSKATVVRGLTTVLSLAGTVTKNVENILSGQLHLPRQRQ